jgi:hypothetical protein
MIELNILNQQDQWHKWWWHFHDYYESQGVDMDNKKEITRVLAEWNAIDLDPESTMFYFENEQDHVMFMLRWA